MGKWWIMLLLAGLSALHRLAAAEDVRILRVCTGDTAHFRNDFNTSGHGGIVYSFTNERGTFQICKIKSSDQSIATDEGYRNRFNLTSPSAVGFTLKKVSSSDDGKYVCLILFPDGTDRRLRWTLRVEDSTELNKPIITTTQNGNCSDYSCSYPYDGKAETETYWRYSPEIRRNGSNLYMCEANRSEIISCVVTSFCRKNNTYFNTTKDCQSRKKRSSSPDSLQNGCPEGEKSPGNDNEAGVKSGGIGWGILIGILIAEALIAAVVIWRRRRGRRKT